MTEESDAVTVGLRSTENAPTHERRFRQDEADHEEGREDDAQALRRPGAKKVDTDETFQAVHVDRIGPNQYAVAHSFEQNGDLVSDPDMTFLRRGDDFYPLTIQQAFGGYRRVVELDGEGNTTAWDPRGYRELRSFAAMWMKNIEWQQDI